MTRVLLAASALLVLSAAPAFAQTAVTGTVAVEGAVASKCTVINGTSASAFGSTISLGELAASDGTLSTTLSGSTAANPAGGSQSFRVNCTQANAGVSVTSTALTNGVTAPTGYSSTVDYQGRVEFATVGGSASPVVFTDDSAASGATTGSLGTGVFLANQAGNVVVKAHSLSAGSGSPLLVAGNYAGSILVVITPGA